MDGDRRVYSGYGRHGLHEGECSVHILFHKELGAIEKLHGTQILAVFI